jgi:hypothetical protein
VKPTWVASDHQTPQSASTGKVVVVDVVDVVVVVDVVEVVVLVAICAGLTGGIAANNMTVMMIHATRYLLGMCTGYPSDVTWHVVVRCLVVFSLACPCHSQRPYGCQ